MSPQQPALLQVQGSHLAVEPKVAPSRARSPGADAKVGHFVHHSQALQESAGLRRLQRHVAASTPQTGMLCLLAA